MDFLGAYDTAAPEEPQSLRALIIRSITAQAAEIPCMGSRGRRGLKTGAMGVFAESVKRIVVSMLGYPHALSRRDVNPYSNLVWLPYEGNPRNILFFKPLRWAL